MCSLTCGAGLSHLNYARVKASYQCFNSDVSADITIQMCVISLWLRVCFHSPNCAQ